MQCQSESRKENQNIKIFHGFKDKGFKPVQFQITFRNLCTILMVTKFFLGSFQILDSTVGNLYIVIGE